jgi:hypothetical protein
MAGNPSVSSGQYLMDPRACPSVAGGNSTTYVCWITSAPMLLMWYKACRFSAIIRKLKSGECRLYSQADKCQGRKGPNLGIFLTREAAEKHERAVQFFKRAH